MLPPSLKKKQKQKRDALYLSVNVFSAQVLVLDAIFMGRTFDMVILATRMSSRLQGKGMSIGPAPVNEPTRLKRSIDWAYPATVELSRFAY